MSNEKLTKKQQRALKNHENNVARRERQQQLQSVKKKAKRGPKEKHIRRKDWLPVNLDPTDPETWDEVEVVGKEYAPVERIMSRGEGERRRELERMAFQRLNEAESDSAEGDESNLAAPPLDEGQQQGQVIEVSSGLCRVETDEGVLLCTIRGALTEMETGFTNVVAVGDQVYVRTTGADAGVVEVVLPRRTILTRPDTFYSHLRQVLVANADQVLIVASWREPAIWLELIDRYLVVAERNQLPAVLCINKIDLAKDKGEVDEIVRLYTGLGVEVLCTSAETGQGVTELRALLDGRLTVFSGLSGVGKSTLLNAVEPTLNLRIGDTSDRKHEGRHTTTQATLHRLGTWATVVDTPGIREFGVAGLHADELIAYFPDLAEAAAQCRFANCTHEDEPGCVVQAEIAAGNVADSRLYSYRKILRTL